MEFTGTVSEQVQGRVCNCGTATDLKSSHALLSDEEFNVKICLLGTFLGTTLGICLGTYGCWVLVWVLGLPLGTQVGTLLGTLVFGYDLGNSTGYSTGYSRVWVRSGYNPWVPWGLTGYRLGVLPFY